MEDFLQKNNNQEQQCIITTPLLEGTDGIEKMSKSYNYIGIMITEEIYGKALSIKDSMIRKWFVLAADADHTIESVEKRLENPPLIQWK